MCVAGLLCVAVMRGVMCIAGLLQVGDIIKEINGHEVHDPDQLQDIMKRCSGSVTLKVLPSFYDPSAFSQVTFLVLAPVV